MKLSRDERIQLQRDIANFNKRVARLEKQGIKFLPSRTTLKEMEQSFVTKRELKRKVNQMNRLTSRNAKTMVRVGKDRVKMSKWQRDVFYADRKVAQRKIEQEVGDYQEIIAKRSGKAPVQSLKRESLKNKLAELDYVTRDISSLSKSQLETTLATTEKQIFKHKQDKVFYDNFFDMMFKDVKVTGLYDNRVETIRNKLSQLSPDQLNLAYNAEPMLKHFVEYYNAKDLSNVQKERDEAEINKMNQNIDNLLERVDKIVGEFKEM